MVNPIPADYQRLVRRTSSIRQPRKPYDDGEEEESSPPRSSRRAQTNIMTNPIPADYQRLIRRTSSIRQPKHEREYYDHDEHQPTKTMTSHPVVFDTMIVASRTMLDDANVLEPQVSKQYLIHSQQSSFLSSPTASSWMANAKTFLQSPRPVDTNDNDALFWCE